MEITAYIASLLVSMMKGIVIGMVASAPMGPVGVLCIRRTIKKGRIYGIVTGAGAALSDIIYALLTGFGMSLITTVSQPRNIFFMKLIGCVMLLAFGVYMYRTGPRAKMRPESNTKGTLFRNFLTSFIITLCNPVIIFLFLALFNMMAPFATASGNPVEMLVGYSSIVVGAMLWWLGLTYVINKMSRTFSEKGVQLINRFIGVLVMAISVIYAVLTLCGISVIATEA